VFRKRTSRLPTEGDQTNGRQLTRSRRLIFRLVAVVLSLGVFVAAEVFLRVAGYGYPTSFFLRQERSGEEILVENKKFGYRFFPQTLSRNPIPCLVKLQKPPGTYRIFIFGESAAQGHPEPAYGFSRILSVLLKARYPDAHFEIINTSMTAINSHVIRMITKDCMPLEGDLWVIYMGHNEVIGPFGTGSIFGGDTPNRKFVQTSLFVQSTRLGQLVRNTLDRLLSNQPPDHWSGLEMFSNTRTISTDPRLQTIYKHFQQNLNDILSSAERAGVQTILCSVASNLQDCPPFASVHSPGLSNPQLAHWQQWQKKGIACWGTNNWTEALEAFQNAASLDEQFAETHYWIGQCLLKLNRSAEAVKRLEVARDLDALRLRADSRINQIILQSADAHRTRRVLSLDTQNYFASQAADPVSGEEFFYEHVHLTFTGNYHLARLVAAKVSESLPAAIRSKAKRSNDWLSAEESARRLGWTPWDRIKTGTEMARWLQTAPFTNQFDSALRQARWEGRLKEWRASEENLPEISGRIYQEAVRQDANDWMLHAKFADFLEANEDLNGAIREWVEVTRLLPSHSQFYSRVGSLLDQQGKSQQAESVFQQALELESDSAEAYYGLGLAQAHQGRYPEAKNAYHRALKLKPQFVEAHINLGLASLALGNTNEAIAHQKTALDLWPENLPARINLGKLLQVQGRLPEAREQFAKAVELQSNNALAHFNLANILVALHRRPEAVQHYLESAKLRPGEPEVHLALGTQLKLEGKLEQSQQELLIALTLDENNPEAHFELGSLLLEKGEEKQGLNHLKKALELNPAHARAANLLSTGSARVKRKF
jgi:tetratricopeptide (TPR) repeat protein